MELINENFINEVENRLDWFKVQRKNFARAQQDIINDESFTADAKRRKINELHLQVSEYIATRKKELFQYVSDEHEKRSRYAFSPGTKDEQKILSFRDATSRVESAKDKARVLADAIDTGDKMMELAAIKSLYQSGKYAVFQSYDGLRKHEVQELLEFEKHTLSHDFKLAMSLHTSKPPIARLSDIK